MAEKGSLWTIWSVSEMQGAEWLFAIMKFNKS